MRSCASCWPISRRTEPAGGRPVGRDRGSGSSACRIAGPDHGRSRPPYRRAAARSCSICTVSASLVTADFPLRQSRVWSIFRPARASRSRGPTARRRRSCARVPAAFSRPISARAWPALSWPLRHQLLDLVRQRQQAQQVGDMAAALAQRLSSCSWVWPNRSISCRYPAASSIAFRSARWMFSMIATSSTSVSRIAAHQDRDLVQLRQLRRAPAAFAGNDLVIVRHARDRAHDQGLDDALFADRCGKFCQARLRRRPGAAGRGWGGSARSGPSCLAGVAWGVAPIAHARR